MKALRIAIFVLVAFGILAHGAVEDWARAVLEIGAGLLFLAWAIGVCATRQQQIVISPLLPPLLGFLLIVLAQWLFGLTASPYATRNEVELLVADILILFLAAQVFRSLDEWRNFIWFVMTLGFLVCLFGILQHLTFNGKLYWFRELRYGGFPFGPYANRNHFAGFAELVIPVSLVPLASGRVRRQRWFVVSLFTVVPIAALFFSASRGGIVSFGVEVGVIVLWLLFRRTTGRRLLSIAVVLLLASLLVSWLGVHQTIERFSSMKSLEVTQGKRTSMAADTWRTFLDHPVLGTGLGTLQIVFPPYETLYDGKVVNHSHNDYLEALAETGILGGVCCLWFLGALLFHSLRNIARPTSPFAATVQLSGLVASLGFLTHSVVDFNLHIPANALLFFLIVSLSTSFNGNHSSAIPEIGTIPNAPRKH